MPTISSVVDSVLQQLTGRGQNTSRRLIFQMTCSLNTISAIDDLSRIRAVLLPHLLERTADNDDPTTETDDDDEMPSKLD